VFEYDPDSDVAADYAATLDRILAGAQLAIAGQPNVSGESRNPADSSNPTEPGLAAKRSVARNPTTFGTQAATGLGETDPEFDTEALTHPLLATA
jgi:hypothetical protein